LDFIALLFFDFFSHQKLFIFCDLRPSLRLFFRMGDEQEKKNGNTMALTLLAGLLGSTFHEKWKGNEGSREQYGLGWIILVLLVCKQNTQTQKQSPSNTRKKGGESSKGGGVPLGSRKDLERSLANLAGLLVYTRGGGGGGGWGRERSKGRGRNSEGEEVKRWVMSAYGSGSTLALTFLRSWLEEEGKRGRDLRVFSSKRSFI